MRREPRDLSELPQAIATTTARAVMKELRRHEPLPPPLYLLASSSSFRSVQRISLGEGPEQSR